MTSESVNLNASLILIFLSIMIYCNSQTIKMELWLFDQFFIRFFACFGSLQIGQLAVASLFDSEHAFIMNASLFLILSLLVGSIPVVRYRFSKINR